MSSLPLLPNEVIDMPPSQRLTAFMEYARYQPECAQNGNDAYAIRVGSSVGGVLFATDTIALRRKFELWVRSVLRRREFRATRGYAHTRLYKTKEAAIAAVTGRHRRSLTHRFCARCQGWHLVNV